MFKKKSSKKAGARGETSKQASWIIEGIVEYLASPTWNTPVLNFVESQCSTFTYSGESSFEQTEVHKQYKVLVEKLLDAYMKELQISEEQFSSACSLTPSNRYITRAYPNFEYIWAADDFLIFKRLMASHNVRLQKEALEMSQSDVSHTKAINFTSEDAEAVTKELKFSKMTIAERKSRKAEEEEDLRLAIIFSKMEMDKLNAIADQEKQLLEQAIRLSLEDTGRSTVVQSNIKSNDTQSIILGDSCKTSKSAGLTAAVTFPQPRKDSQHMPADPVIHSAPQTKIENISPQQHGDVPAAKSNDLTKVANSSSGLPPLKLQKNTSNAEATDAWLDQAMQDILENRHYSSVSRTSTDPMHGSINSEELAKRRAYLQAQRDKLLVQKRKKRGEELEEFMTTTKKETSADTEEEKTLASRRAVAQRLKLELIDKRG